MKSNVTIRVFAALILTALFNLQALAQSVKDVSVTNVPSVSEAITPYVKQIVDFDWHDNVDCSAQNTFLVCPIFVPEGKLLIIERITAFFPPAQGNVIDVDLRDQDGARTHVVLIPKTNASVMVADGPVYVRDTNAYATQSGSAADALIGLNGGTEMKGIVVTGRLVDIRE